MSAVVLEVDGHRRVIAIEDVAEGDLVWLVDGPLVSSPTETSVQVEPGVHVEDPVVSHVRHSRVPTCEVRDGALYALTSLVAGDQITIDRPFRGKAVEKEADDVDE